MRLVSYNQQISDFLSSCGNIFCPEHGKDALELSKMQEVTSQLKHQEAIKV